LTSKVVFDAIALECAFHFLGANYSRLFSSISW
jgi:hypothetical protein